jgi:hypothetical protein
LGYWGIDVKLAESYDSGETFGHFITLTDRPWDPLLNAPFAHGDSSVQFIGEYFGLDAHEKFFTLMWTDTRTGVQEMWSDQVLTERARHRIDEIYAQVFGGVAKDGGGWIIVGGKIVRVPPRSPVIKILEAAASYVSASHLGKKARMLVQNGVIKEMKNILGKNFNRVK